LIHIDITMRHGTLPRELEMFIREKLQRLQKYLKDSSRFEVVLDREHELHRCELLLHSLRRQDGQVIVKAEHADLHACIDGAVEKLDRQLAKHKERRKDHHRGQRRPEGLPAEEPPEDPSYEDIVKKDIRGK
jgi:putative sigma-54 modulation protein